MQEVKVRVKGQMDKDWSNWLGAMTITHTKQGETVLSGKVSDQAALYGLLFRLSDLGLQLVSVTSDGRHAGRSKEAGQCER
jgi:hypothetical protein